MKIDVNEVEQKIKNGESLTEKEREACAWGEVGKLVTTTDGAMHRWTMDKQTIFDIDGQLYGIDWEEGLTEYQEHEYWNNPYKVTKRTEMIEVVYYDRVEENN